ncbi:MAG: hypothetical protein ABJN26_11145 [Stappiaceae bacterium]
MSVPKHFALAVVSLLSVGGLAACVGGEDTAAPSTTTASSTGSSQGRPTLDPSLFVRPAACPGISVQDGTHALQIFSRGKLRNSENLSYQASITKWARECNRAGDQIQVKIGVAGRVTAGQAGAPAKVVLPLRIVVLNSDGSVRSSDVQKIEVAMAENDNTEPWSYVDDTLLLPSDANLLRVVVGFDEQRK